MEIQEPSDNQKTEFSSNDTLRVGEVDLRIQSACMAQVRSSEACAPEPTAPLSDYEHACESLARTHAPEVIEHFNCLAQLPCGMDRTSCTPPTRRSNVVEKLCDALEESCDQASIDGSFCSSNYRDQWIDFERNLRASAIEPLEECADLARTQCGAATECMRNWQDFLNTASNNTKQTI